MAGQVISLNISQKKGQKKTPVGSFELVEGKGVAGDAHFGSERQVSFLPLESVQKMQAEGLKVKSGSFAENITVEGIDFKEVVCIGSRLKLGEAVVEITDIGKNCHAPCAIYRQAGYCVMPEDGVFAKIIKGGKVKQGDSCVILK